VSFWRGIKSRASALREARLRLPEWQPGRGASNLASMLSLVGLIAAGVLTFSLIQNPVPLPQSAQPTSGASVTPYTGLLSSKPSGGVVSGGKVSPLGSVAYARGGNIYVQTGTKVVEVVASRNGSVASQPTWSPDGAWLYYIDSRPIHGWWLNPNEAGYDYYLLPIPVLARVRPDGIGQQDIVSGILQKRNLTSFYWITHPSISPDGQVAAVITDGPKEPGFYDNVLRFINIGTGSFMNTPLLHEVSPFGHSDPAFSPDGKQVAYVMETRYGNEGDPSLWLYDVASKTSAYLATGYRNPSWSPDGKYIAVTKSGAWKPDIAIIDASTGKQVGQITSDGQSWAPVWSQAGDALIYMHLDGSTALLRMVYLSVTDGQLWFQAETNLIDILGLDSGSAPAWTIPASARPKPTPTPSPTPSALPPSPSSSPVPSSSAS
jgi:Tol biopolymer transport system component